ncbi:NADPH-dependent FMN reductase [Aminobacter carboxidus]|nr:NAD(P)H-dependent oxidoreductase [Aminobacter carboxidus]
MIDILAISGSLRAVSSNRALIAALARNTPPGCRVSVYDGLGRLPIFNPDDEYGPDDQGGRTPREATALIDAIT